MIDLVEKYDSALNSKRFIELKESEKYLMARLLENTEKEKASFLAEGTLSSDIQVFTNILLPLVRRVQPALIANSLVGVSPLSGPNGYIYVLRNRYVGDGNHSISPTSAGQVVQLGNGQGTNVQVGDEIKSGTKIGIVVYKEGDKLLIKNNSNIFAPGDEISVGTTVVGTVFAIYSNEAAFTRIFKNYTGPYTTSVGETLSKDIREVGISIERVLVEAKTRKLKTQYTIEMLQDLQAVHGLNAEEELMNFMAYELQAELDREIIDYVNSQATVTPDAVLNSYDGRWEIEKYRALALKIEDEAREIGRLTRRGSGNTLLISPKVAVMLKALGGFSTSVVNSEVESTSIASVAGTFEGMKVIIDNMAQNQYVTVLYKGDISADNAVIYAPYTPAQFTKTTNFESGQPVLHLSTRYALFSNPLDSQNYIRTFNVSIPNSSPLK